MNSILSHFDVARHDLPNGLRVLVREDHSAPVVAIFTHVLAGYFDEPDEWVGVSHVLEHMYFKGTPTRGPGQIAQQTKTAGGYLNASTIYDHTSYYTVLPATELARGLEVQSDALLNSLIDDEELRKELLVIIQEAKRKLDNPAAIARETLYEVMFDKHRIRRWRIGYEEQLRNFTRADVYGFFERFYRAGSISLIIAGDVDTATALELVKERYAGLRAGEPKRDRGPAEPAQRTFRYREISGDVTDTRIELGWHSAPPLHDDTCALDVLALVLGQGRASYLYRFVRDRGLASSVSAHNYTPTELGVFGISAEVDAPEALRCLQQISRVLADVRNGGITDADIERAKNIMEARMLRGLETMEGQASFIAEWEALGDWRIGVDYMERVQRIRKEDLVRVAVKYLPLEHAALLVYRPQNTPELNITLQDLQHGD